MVERNMPRHIAIIMDGNGRWAKARGQKRTYGHRVGALAIKSAVRCAVKNGVQFLTCWAFSTENWNRPEEEVNYLMQLFDLALRKYTNILVKNDIKLLHIGDKSRLPKNVAKKLQLAEELTKNCSTITLVVAMNYGARDEILQAVKLFTEDCLNDRKSISELDWPMFSSYLYTKDVPDPELIIRTSGEHRLSNFMLVQAAYSELYFTDVYWPDFTEGTLQAAIDDYKSRDRRFGKIKE